jgi:hypothetical protein
MNLGEEKSKEELDERKREAKVVSEANKVR